MKLQRGIRARLGGALLAAVAAVAILALPGLASSHDGGQGRPAAGVIESFDPETGVLTVDLTKGDTISALVVDRTRIRCGKPHRRHHRGRSHARAAQRPSRGGDQSGVRDEVQGPRDQGEDAPGHDGTPPGASEGPGRGAEHSDRCGTDDLIPGTVVKRAEIVLTHGNAYYSFVGLPRLAKPTDEQPEPESETEPEG